MSKVRIFSLLLSFLFLTGSITYSQVNSVQFGRNRIQYKKFKWNYFQTEHFNVYYAQGGEALAKFVLQCAEEELPIIEERSEHNLQRRANIILYNSYTDFKQSNIGLETITLTAGGTARLVNNKIPIYYNSDHAHLRLQIKHGIADVIIRNLLFGDDLGEMAGNQTLLDLPKWLIDGYIGYLAEAWNTKLDDRLRSLMLEGKYKKFSSFAFAEPELAGRAFWFFLEEKYKKENTAYFLYLARTYKNINRACEQVSKKNFKQLLAEFMLYEEDKYYEDISRRRAIPKGNVVESFDINKKLNYFRFNVNPNKKNSSYVVSQYKNGIVRVILFSEDDPVTLIKYGIRSLENEIHPNYPLMAWDPKGEKISVIYFHQGKLKLFVYNVEKKYRETKIDVTDLYEQVQDVKYMYDSKTLVLSATKNGQSDIYTYELDKQRSIQVTNDVFDDLDPAYVAFPNKRGIIFSSNRPSAADRGSDSSLPSKQLYNVFLVTEFGSKAEINQVTQLSGMKYGNARFPTQYNTNHFTFICDENGIVNRYAGFFTTEKAGLDTLVLVGEEILRNPDQAELDSSLQAQGKEKPDSIAVVSVSIDSAYTFPISNYPANIAESRIAGDSRQVSEVTQAEGEKTLYKLKIDENTLYRRNVTAAPTQYMKKLMRESKLTQVKPAAVKEEIKIPAVNEFQSEFETGDSNLVGQVYLSYNPAAASVLESAKRFPYKPIKFSIDFGTVGFNSDVLVNRYQAYQNGAGPITLNSGTPLNGMIRMGTSDLMEDKRITGGYKLSTNLEDNEWLISYQNYRRKLDWSTSYYRNTQGIGILLVDGSGNPVNNSVYPGKVFTNLYQAGVSYPIDESRRIRLSSGIRSDKTVIRTADTLSAQLESERALFSVTHIEYVYDNVLNPANNIWDGLRYKFYMDWNYQVNQNKSGLGKNMFNFGFDGRYYYPIFRNFIWAGRVAGDFSSGDQKIVYYLGGVDSWVMLGNNQKRLADGSTKYRYFNTPNQPAEDQAYAFQSLAVNMRGFIQNIANGSNAVVINSEFRLPVYSTLVEKVTNNAFLNNLQLVQFIDLGTAWNGKFGGIKRPQVNYSNPDVAAKIKAGGIGPFAGGYGFGVRSMLFGYFLKFDVAWPMNGFFRGAPVKYLSLGFDF